MKVTARATITVHVLMNQPWNSGEQCHTVARQASLAAQDRIQKLLDAQGPGDPVVIQGEPLVTLIMAEEVDS